MNAPRKLKVATASLAGCFGCHTSFLDIDERNRINLAELFEEVYVTEETVDSGLIPNDPELPLLLDKVYPLHELVQIDYFLPGCPPPADAFWKLLTDLLDGRTPRLGFGLMHYD